jgi:hypothetical protein
MQKPVRYYITKTDNGEEPTVRSVRVALNVPDHDLDTEAAASPVAETTNLKPARRMPSRPAGVKRLVKDAIRRRPADQ